MLIPFGVFSAGVSGGDSGGGSLDLISTTLLGSDTASVTFDVTGLGSTYKHLQIRLAARCSVSDTFSIIRFNSDSGSNYSSHQLGGDGSSVFGNGGGGANNTSMWSHSLANDSNAFTAGITDILDPFSTTKNKTIRSLGGFVDSSIKKIIMRSGAWYSTSAVTAVTLSPYTGNFATGSRFSLYGIKG